MNTKSDIGPILKWAGGKRQLLMEMSRFFPSEYGVYYEPFVGGGSVLFYLHPSKAVINDYNYEIFNVYNVIKTNCEPLIKKLTIHEENHSKEYYYQIRGLDRVNNYEGLTEIDKAARVIYLNRTCYNGLYRVNRDGYFNTPIGRYNKPPIVNEERIRSISKYLSENMIEIMCGDFTHALKNVKENDFVYLDPPYDPINSTSSFTDYTEYGFGKDDQVRLKKECDRLSNIGAFFMQSNSDTNYIRDLYHNYRIIQIEARRSINSKGNNRKNAQELLILNY